MIYYLLTQDLGDMESVLREFDTVIFEKATPDNVLALVDGTSLLWRLELMGIDAGERRWERLTESCAKLIGSHGLAWLVVYARTVKNMSQFLWTNDTVIRFM